MGPVGLYAWSRYPNYFVRLGAAAVGVGARD